MVIVPVDRRSDPSGFAAAERAIFAYRLGPGRPDYHGDPLAIEARYEALLAGKNPAAIEQWLRRDNLTVRLLGLRRLLPVIRGAFGLPAFAEATSGDLTVAEAMRLLGRFFAFQDRIQVRWRREAELLVTYGPMPGRVHTFERELGLWLNRDRAQGFAGLAHWRGAIAAAGVAQAHFGLVDAMAPNLEAAHELENDIENDRIQAEAQARSRKGTG